MCRQSSRNGAKRASDWYRFCRRLGTLDVTELMILHGAGLNEGPLPEGVEICFLSADYIRQLAATPAYELDATLADHLECGGSVCVGAWVGSRLASYAWYAFDLIEEQHNRGAKVELGTALSFPPDVAFLYKGFTHEDFRGQGLYRCLHRFALHALASRGVRSILTTADWSNRAALRSCYALGFLGLGRIWRIGCGGRSIGFYPAVVNQYGIRVGACPNP